MEKINLFNRKGIGYNFTCPVVSNKRCGNCGQICETPSEPIDKNKTIIVKCLRCSESVELKLDQRWGFITLEEEHTDTDWFRFPLDTTIVCVCGKAVIINEQQSWPTEEGTAHKTTKNERLKIIKDKEFSFVQFVYFKRK